MNRRAMKAMSHGECHQCAPREWRGLPNLTGDYDLDSTIEHRSNKDLPHRLALYTRRGSAPYNPRSAYNGYAGYHGDE
jgi:hypothetical protein